MFKEEHLTDHIKVHSNETGTSFKCHLNTSNYLCFTVNAANGESKKMNPENSPKKEKTNKFPIDYEKVQKRFRTELVKTKCTNDNWEIYKKYCKEIHGKNDEKRHSFEAWLCASNLEYKIPNQNAKILDPNMALEYGCYHMNWYLDEKLIAVGV